MTETLNKNSPDQPGLNQRLILTVDDEPHILKALNYMLSQAGYRIISARDGQEALEAVRGRKPALVISDIMMPRLDGYGLCDKLRSQASTALIPFIFLTAKDHTDDRVRGIRTGADGYLTKPFNRDELLALVETVLRRHRVYIEQSMRDELTGLPNRKLLGIILEEEHARARRYRRKLAVAMIDLDHFKRVNDLFGHPVGDRVLIKVSDTLRAAMRRQDRVGRWGGEEFLAILPETGRREAATLLNRCRKNLKSLKFEKDGKELPVEVTLSAGISELNPADCSIAEMIEAADQALYRAKEEGRNRVKADGIE